MADGSERGTAVIITAKDAASTIAMAIRSALAQRDVIEVMVVDDGSADDTAAVARSCDDGRDRLTVTRLDHNRGPSHGRNLAIATTRAPLLCILDADDFMADDRIARLLDGNADGRWDLLADDMDFASGPDAALAYDRLFLPGDTLPRTIDLAGFVTGNLPNGRERRHLGFLKPLMRRAFVDRHGLRYDEGLRLGEDMLLYAECLALGARFRVVAACGYYAVERPDSLSGRHGTVDLAGLHGAFATFEADRPAAAATVRPYTRFIENRLAVREALDAKRAGGWPGLVRALRRRPRSIGFVLRDLVGAKFKR